MPGRVIEKIAGSYASLQRLGGQLWRGGEDKASTRILAIGQSHLAAIFHGEQGMREENRLPDALAMNFIQLRNPRYDPFFPRGNKSELNPALQSDLEANLKDTDLVVSCLGGNAHSIFGLVNHPRPYDFVLNVGDSIAEGREIVSRDLIRSALREQMRSPLRLFSALRALIDQPMVHCESPPPIPSEAHIREYPRTFAKAIGQFGVAPASFRLKLWKLQSEIYRETCASHDVEFLPVPAEVLDENGMMVSKAWGQDPTHGNSWYGERVILQLAAHRHRRQ